MPDPHCSSPSVFTNPFIPYQLSDQQSRFKMSVDEMEDVVQHDADFKTNFELLDRAVAQFDPRFTLRALRSISSLRKKLTGTRIAGINLKRPVPEILAEAEKELSGASKVPEVRIYIGILIQVKQTASSNRHV